MVGDTVNIGIVGGYNMYVLGFNQDGDYLVENRIQTVYKTSYNDSMLVHVVEVIGAGEGNIILKPSPWGVFDGDTPPPTLSFDFIAHQ